MNESHCRKTDQQICPYGAKKKCTYGNKCKFFHPERVNQPHKSVTERLSDFANYHLQARNTSDANKKQVQGKSLSVPLNNNNSNFVTPTSSATENFHRKQLCRTSSNVPSSSNMVPSSATENFHRKQQLSPQQYRLAPGQALSASTSPTNNMMPHLHQQQQPQQQQQQFPKSHSIDNLNLPRDMYQQQQQQQKPVSYSNSNLWNQGQQPDSINQTSAAAMQQQLDSQDSLNLHKKLQRQLSLLNPYDPRLYPMQRYHNQQHNAQQSAAHPEHFQLSSPAHKPLSASHSLTAATAPGQNQTHSMYEHQVSC